MKSTIYLKLVSLVAALFVCTSLWAQQATVSGVVKDANGPLPGVNVTVAGTTVGVTTDADGRYRISTDARATLEFSFIGYRDERVAVGSRTTIDVMMEEEANTIDELVVVGYGYQRKSDVATSVTSVKADEMKTFPSSNVADMLRGRAAGVQVNTSSGRPGAIPTITIRGARSIAAENAPLYIIDGSPSNATEFSTLSAEDVESIEILKDAAAQAIYGARASDGVILVTTKRGSVGKTEIAYNGYVGIQRLWRNFDFYSGQEYFNLRREAKANDAGLLDAREMSVEDALGDEIMARVWASGKSVDWEKLMFRNALYHNHDISVRGGNEKLKVAASAGFFDQNGMARLGSGYQRGTFRINADLKVNKWFSMGVNASYAITSQKREDGNFSEFITRPPLSEVYDADGNYTELINSSGHINPLYRAEHFDRRINRDSYRLNFFADIKPFKGFNYRFNASIYQRFDEDKQAKDADYPGGGASARITNDRTKNWLIENIFTYQLPIRNEQHKLSLTAVQSIDHNLKTSLGYTTDNLPVDKGPDFIANGEFSGKPERTYNENNLVSFMARAQYSLMDRYLLNVAVRIDGSSRFGINNKWGTFPSVALAWRMNQEGFLREAGWIDNLKLRLSYGIVGNQNGIGNYETLGLADGHGYEFGDEYLMGYLPGTDLSNPNLKWERSATVNAGVDFGFWNNRFSGTVEFYDTRTSDLLVKRGINSALGYTSMLDNLGKTRSWGIDVGLTGEVLRKQDFSWSISSNFSLFRNEIVRIDDTLDEYGRPASQPANNWFVGKSINVYYNYKPEGIFQYDDFDITKDAYGNIVYKLKPTIDTDGDGIADKAMEYTNAVKPGMVKIRDLNGDGRINADDRTPISKDPDFTLSLSTTLRWKGFEFFMDWYGVHGGRLMNPFLHEANSGGSLQGKLNGVKVDYWTPYNPSNKFPRPSFNTNATYQGALAIQDTSYIRLRTLQIGYNFPKRWISKLGMGKLRVYATATNLLTFTELLSYSPELSPGAYPEPQTFVFGANLTF
ncbi:TonB-dependent receptor [uncultured Alistipes sp.]|uniref:SusC/RagA family TonB-linked outer membrane protein n=1 Tax=uncultured Alistipes sp. TaxID=538949 RepID=UPI00265DE778|nr:TonB-dependent receptor [uncultured Alistipes sp.]